MTYVKENMVIMAGEIIIARIIDYETVVRVFTGVTYAKETMVMMANGITAPGIIDDETFVREIASVANAKENKVMMAGGSAVTGIESSTTKPPYTPTMSSWQTWRTLQVTCPKINGRSLLFELLFWVLFNKEMGKWQKNQNEKRKHKIANRKHAHRPEQQLSLQANELDDTVSNRRVD